MSRGKFLIKGSLFRAVNLFVSIALSFFMMPFLVHSLGDKQYGIWTLVATFIGYYDLLDLGISSAVSRFVARTIGSGDMEKRRKLISTSFYLFLSLGLLAFLITAVFAIFAGVVIHEESDVRLFRILLLIMGGTISITFLQKVFVGILYAHLRYDINSSIQFWKTIVKAILIVVAIRSGWALIGLAGVTAACNILFGLPFVVAAIRMEPAFNTRLSNIDPSSVKEMLGYSIYVFIGRVADIFKYKLDSFVIAKFINLVAVTHYGVALRLMEYFINFIMAVVGNIFPVFSQEEGKGDYDSIRKKFYFTTKLSSFLSFFFGLMAVLYSEPFIARWMGEEYSDAYQIILILAGPITLGLAQNPLFGVLYGISKHQMITYVNVGEGIAKLILSIILVRHHGIVGVALGTFISMMITTTAIYPYYLCRTLKISLSGYYGIMLKYLALAVIFVGVPWFFLRPLLLPAYLPLFACAFGQALCYGLAVFFIGLTSDDRKYLLKFFKRK